MAVPPGTRFGPYDITAKIGAGGMGEVYRARDTRLHRDVALKMLPAAVTRDPARRERFVQEARAASALEHPRIAVIHDIGEADGVTFRIAFTTADSDGPHLWVAALDRQSPPRKLPVTSPDSPRFANDYIYYLARELAPEGAPPSVAIRRIRVDGTGDERIATKDFWRGAVFAQRAPPSADRARICRRDR